jgi:hypothetical protein
MHSHIHATSASLMMVASETTLERTAARQRAVEVRTALLRASSSLESDSDSDELSMVDGDGRGGGRHPSQERPERQPPTPRRRIGDRQTEGDSEIQGPISMWA